MCVVQGAQLYIQMATGLSDRKERLKKKMGYLWTAQTKEPEQKFVCERENDHWVWCVAGMPLRMTGQAGGTEQLILTCLSLLTRTKSWVSPSN